YYYLSIGTNINAKSNAVKIIRNIVLNFGSIIVFPFIKTKPYKIVTKNYFLNSIVILKSSKNAQEVKAITNGIEIDMGRDRNDKFSSIKDRVADIDIIHVSSEIDIESLSEHCEFYLQDSLFSNKKSMIYLDDFGLPRIDRATTINFDSSSGDIVIINYEPYSL
ncbi:2-amino-4-hydroxy-6-hydroxymethyldihydropteridine diphosphokinase, partial [Shewanella sp. Isolate7]|uniref:2-amino-4-hydroxy-6- hydroxymethyldihydropteridine diphosphokinase n=1 Tax=Shewanella sp. Isolate7 TaxID=2908528 RepID=UPI001EFC9EAF